MYLMQGCEQVGFALNVPSTAVLCGYMQVCGFLLSPSIVKVSGKDWAEPVLLWLTISMPTGSGKSTLSSPGRYSEKDLMCMQHHRRRSLLDL